MSKIAFFAKHKTAGWIYVGMGNGADVDFWEDNFVPSNGYVATKKVSLD